MSQKLNRNLSEPEIILELEKYCNEEVPIIKIQKSIPDQKPISLPNRPSSGTELEMQNRQLERLSTRDFGILMARSS